MDPNGRFLHDMFPQSTSVADFLSIRGAERTVARLYHDSLVMTNIAVENCHRNS